jgi:hypothetical protein
MVIVLSTEIDDDVVLRAGLGAKVRKDSEAPGGEDVRCSVCCCDDRIVVSVGVSSREAFGPHVAAGSAGERHYVFDQCKSMCSSSRNHLRSRLVLMVDGLPGIVPLVSPPFNLNSREKHKPAAPIIARPIAGQTTSVVVRVFTTICSPSEMNALTEHFVPLIRRLSGYLDFRCQAVPGFAISFSTFDTPVEADATTGVIARYMANRVGYANPYGVDLARTGIAILIATCTSY